MYNMCIRVVDRRELSETTHPLVQTLFGIHVDYVTDTWQKNLPTHTKQRFGDNQIIFANSEHGSRGDCLQLQIFKNMII